MATAKGREEKEENKARAKSTTLSILHESCALAYTSSYRKYSNPYK